MFKTSNQSFPHKIVRAILLITFLSVAAGYSILIPPGEGVDEIPHFHYVRYVKEQRRLPRQLMTLEEDVEVRMGHHPPLYYALGALVIAPIDTSDFNTVFQTNPHFVWLENTGANGWNVMLHFGQDTFPWQKAVLALHLVRVFTVLLGGIAVYSLYSTLNLVFPKEDWAPLGGTALIAFNPSFLFMSSTVHHDTLQATIFAVAIWWSIRFLSEERRYDSVIAGLIIGAGLLTKISGAALAATMGVVLVIKALHKQNLKWLFTEGLQIFGVALLVAGWWYIRNQLLYGDPLGWEMFLNIHRHMVRGGPYTWEIFINEFLGQIGRTFWGGFGYMHITFPEITRYLWWLAGVAGIGLLIALYRNPTRIKNRWASWTVLLTVLGLLFISFLRFSMTTTGAGHGRYLFPAAVSISALLTIGLNGFTNWHHQRAISLLVTASMLPYAIWLPVTQVMPKYAPPKTATSQQMAQIQTFNAKFTTGVRLVGYHVSEQRVNPGQWITVKLYWQAEGEPGKRSDPRALLEAIDEEGNQLAENVSWPLPSMPPRVWKLNTTYITNIALGLPDAELPGKLYFRVQPLDVPGNAVILGELLTTGGAVSINAESIPEQRSEVFKNTIKLRHLEITPNPVSPGETTNITLYWEVLETTSSDYTVFIHLLDSEGDLITQFDRPAGGTENPTSAWKAAQIMRDTYPLSVPEETPTGEYALRLGMYTWPSLERLPITIDNADVGDHINIATITVENK